MQPVRLVVLLLSGPREGENDILEFPSLEEAIAYGRELHGGSQFQIDSIEDQDGKTIINYEYLNELCSTGGSRSQHQYG